MPSDRSTLDQMDSATLLAEDIRTVTSPEFAAAVEGVGQAAKHLGVVLFGEGGVSGADPDLERLLLDDLPEDRRLAIDDPSPELRALVSLAAELEAEPLRWLLGMAQVARDR